MERSLRKLPAKLDMIDEAMVPIIRSKSGAERLRIANDMYASAGRMLLSHLRAEHPDWTEQQVRYEVARRLSHGAI